METRPLGETGQESSILTFGAIALDPLEQSDATAMVEDVLAAGVNHVDVAPTYGTAESKLAPALADHRDEIFLAAKTQERTYNGFWGELHVTLDRLGADSLDLFQFHAVTSDRELDAITGGYSPEMAQDGHDPGALAAARDAKERGLIDNIGLTSHGDPSLIHRALSRMPGLDTVMFPLNPTLDARRGPQHDYRSVLKRAKRSGIGTIAIKAFAKGEWDSDLKKSERPYHTWYDPYDEAGEIADCLTYTLTDGPDTIVNAGDPELVAPILEAAREFEPMDEADREALREERVDQNSPVPKPY
ncbi:aldo/keto reductase [Halococcoides cellulosivorans]|uniref:Oxidoreductase n=1 Tax=Halococcoides cellulosivorans TaxID=1679096 RepID=A0A2R4WZL8_9EURY|nr:aldo/keto reductase [Halococcoides cellulosivorans]AWB26996.1 oxidoreductase [Halococcoides cellulosivorans]